MSSSGARAAAALFNPDRLELARQAAGFRKNELAEAIGVSAAAISQFEHGHAKPGPASMAKLALALGVPVEYFGRDSRPFRPANPSTSFFRSLRSTRQRDRTTAAARAERVWEIVQILERHIVLPEYRLPRFAVPRTADRVAIEAVADEVRRECALPPGPVAHVLRLLETHGVVVARLDGIGSEVDAFTTLSERPIVILWRGKHDKARSRFDAAHELGHLVLHPEADPGNKILERQADAFAAAFLMPREYMLAELPRRVSFSHLLGLKEKWGVSLAALLFRSRTLGLISESAYRRAMARMASEGWRRQEPGDLGQPEQPHVLARALDLLQPRGLTVMHLANEARLPVHVVSEIVGADDRAILTLLPRRPRDSAAGLDARPTSSAGPSFKI